jgi:hypothetical protein
MRARHPSVKVTHCERKMLETGPEVRGQTSTWVIRGKTHNFSQIVSSHKQNHGIRPTVSDVKANQSAQYIHKMRYEMGNSTQPRDKIWHRTIVNTDLFNKISLWSLSVKHISPVIPCVRAQGLPKNSQWESIYSTEYASSTILCHVLSGRSFQTRYLTPMTGWIQSPWSSSIHIHYAPNPCLR